MTVVDLTQKMDENIPLFLNTPRPSFEPVHYPKRAAFRETRMAMLSHTGTHIDAPAHLLSDGLFLDQMPASRFVGPGLVLNCSSFGAGRTIGRSFFEARESEIRRVDFLLLHTGWSRHWDTPEEYLSSFPVLDRGAAEYLATLGLKGLGLDMPSVDPLEDSGLQTHQILAGSGMVLVENLCRLGKLLGREFTFCALPLLYGHADGSPVRAVALLPDEDPAL